MKGVILDFSIQSNSGVISGDDSKRYTFPGAEWKAQVNPAPGLRVDFDSTAAGQAVAIYTEISQAAIQQSSGKLNLVGLSPYYQQEFKKIWDSQESYKGKWNWAAFFFEGIWALTKGAWLSAVVSLGVCLITGGFAGFVYCFVFGMRGNYIYYTLHVKNKQLYS